MSKKVSIIAICIIIVVSLVISIYIPNREKIEETEDPSINYSIIEKNGKSGVAKNGDTIIEPQYDEIIIPNSHRAVFMCKNSEKTRCARTQHLIWVNIKAYFTKNRDENIAYMRNSSYLCTVKRQQGC